MLHVGDRSKVEYCVRSKVDRGFWEGMGGENGWPDRVLGGGRMRQDPEARVGVKHDGHPPVEKR